MIRITQLVVMLVLASGLWFARSDLVPIDALREEVKKDLDTTTIQVTDNFKEWENIGTISRNQTIIFLEGWDSLSDNTFRWLDQHRSCLQVEGRLVLILTDKTLARFLQLAPHLYALVQPLGLDVPLQVNSGCDLRQAMIEGGKTLALTATTLMHDPYTPTDIRIEAIKALSEFEDAREALLPAQVADAFLVAARELPGQGASRHARLLAIQWAGTYLPVTTLHHLYDFLKPPWQADTWQATLQAIQVIAEVENPQGDLDIKPLSVRVRTLMEKYVDPNVSSTSVARVFFANLVATDVLLGDMLQAETISTRLQGASISARDTVIRLMHRRYVDLTPNLRGHALLGCALASLKTLGA